MKKFAPIFIILLSFASGFSQKKSIDDLLGKFNKNNVPYISVDSLCKEKNIILLDARETEEYQVSHIKNTIHAGFENFSLDSIVSVIQNKEQTIVVYCSLGVRSEIIANKLIEAGFSNVFNLYGGIFEWKNNGCDVYDIHGNKTENVHVYSQEWSEYLEKGDKKYE